MPSKKAMIGWVLVSYFLIAGGFTMAAAAVSLLGLESQLASQAVFFIGALMGGLVAGRASRHKAVAEPAIAGLLLVLTMVAVFSLGLGWRFAWSEAGDGALAVALKMGLVCGLGGLVGGLLGRRSRSGAPSDSALRWWGVALLLNLGTTFVLVVLAFLTAADSDGRPSDDAALPVVFLAIAVGALSSGFIAQSIAPRKMIWTCGAGTFGIVLFGAAFSVGHGNHDLSGIIGAAILGGLGTLVGAFGAFLGWQLIASHREPAPAVDIPQVRLHS